MPRVAHYSTTQVAKWTATCGCVLHRLMGYVRTTQFCCRTRVSVGDASKSLLSALVLQIGTIVERVVTQRSAAGCHKVVVSPGPECVEANARDVYRIRHQMWSSLRKRSYSWSMSFFFSLMLWSATLPHVPASVVHEDNEAMVRISRTGKHPMGRSGPPTRCMRVHWYKQHLPQL